MCEVIYGLFVKGKIGSRVEDRMLTKIAKAKRHRGGEFLYPTNERGAKLRVQFCRRRQKELS